MATLEFKLKPFVSSLSNINKEAKGEVTRVKKNAKLKDLFENVHWFSFILSEHNEREYFLVMEGFSAELFWHLIS